MKKEFIIFLLAFILGMSFLWYLDHAYSFFALIGMVASSFFLGMYSNETDEK